MSMRVAALLAVSFLLLAGCSAKLPEGTLKSESYSPPVSGSVVTFYQPFANANPTSAVPTAGPMTECAQNQISNPAPAGGNPQDQALPRCKGPYTTFAAHAQGLPMSSGAGYKLYAVGPGYEFEVCSLQVAGTAASCTANNTKEDMSSKVKEIQLRMDGFNLASVPGTAANNTLALNPALASISVLGTYKGKHLDLTVTGLPTNATYTGKLYVKDAASATGFTAKESFDVKEGTNAYDSPTMNIGDFAEFHLHVSTSALNLYKATFEPAPK